MGPRVRVQRYNLRSANSYIVHETSLHDDLNTVDGHSTEIIEPLADCNAVTDENLDKVDPPAVEFMHESYQNTLPVHNEGTDGGHSGLDANTPLIDDTSPIEAARVRFLDFIIDNFIGTHIIEVTESETDETSQPVEEKLSKRKGQDVRCEGDPQFVLPTMYVANMYETLVNEVNMRLPTLDGWGEKTIGVGIEAAGGLYRKFAKKFPKKGSCAFKRQELTTSLETRSRFPEIVMQKEKRVRFMVVHGLDIIERPTIANIDDAEWFKRLTGRSDVAVSPRDYKFYAPRHKHRRYGSATMSPKIPCLQPPSHLGGHLHVPPASPAKFCDECGAPYLRETSKFCSECGVRRPGI